jgi:hypothetical protein
MNIHSTYTNQNMKTRNLINGEASSSTLVEDLSITKNKILTFIEKIKIKDLQRIKAKEPSCHYVQCWDMS